MSFSRFLLERGVLRNYVVYRCAKRHLLNESKNNPKIKLTIPTEDILNNINQENIIVKLSNQALLHFEKYKDLCSNGQILDDEAKKKLKEIFDIDAERNVNKTFFQQANLNINDSKDILKIINFLSDKFSDLVSNYDQYKSYFKGCSIIQGNKVENEVELPDVKKAKEDFYVAFEYLLPLKDVDQYDIHLSVSDKNILYFKFDFRVMCQITNDGKAGKRIPMHVDDENRDYINVSQNVINSQVFTISIHLND